MYLQVQDIAGNVYTGPDIDFEEFKAKIKEGAKKPGAKHMDMALKDFNAVLDSFTTMTTVRFKTKAGNVIYLNPANIVCIGMVGDDADRYNDWIEKVSEPPPF